MTGFHLSRPSFLVTVPVSRSSVSIVPSRMMPAQVTAMFRCPKVFTVSATNRAVSASLVTSAWMPMATPPVSRISASTRLILSCCMSMIATFAPLATRYFATASPMPFAPPVTIATLPLISMMNS